MSYSRPLSAQHNKTSFGEFYMTKKMDIIPKVSNYQVDGFGRDSYISYNNGGCKRDTYELGSFKFASKEPKLRLIQNKNNRISSKVSIYKSDGFGRDQYIV